MPAEIHLLLAAAKGALLIGAALLLVSSAPRASAATRHAVLFAAMAGALFLVPLGATLPTFSPFSIPSRPGSASPELRRLRDNAILLFLVRSDVISDLPVRSSLRAVAERRRVGILTVWLAGTSVVLFRIAADLAAARRALARATIRGRCGPGVPLLASAEIDAPVPWVCFARPS